ncbi:HAD-IB family hydrolase [Streptomyces mirabilis]
MAALGWLTPRRRSATARSVLAGEASAEAARKSSQELEELAHDAAPDAAAPDREPEFPVLGDEKAAAFFDLDNTVMQGAALFHFGRGLYKRKFFETRDLARFAWQQAWFRLAGVEDPEHMQDARDSALSIVKGHRVAELMSIGEEIYDEYMAERIWPGTRALAQAHLDAGQKVWLVTAAPVEIATVIARRLGLTGALGTVAESVDGVYTGKLVGEPLHGPAKAEAVRALAAAEGLDLSRCAAYSDSHNDIPMLSLAEQEATRPARVPDPCRDALRATTPPHRPPSCNRRPEAAPSAACGSTTRRPEGAQLVTNSGSVAEGGTGLLETHVTGARSAPRRCG